MVEIIQATFAVVFLAVAVYVGLSLFFKVFVNG
jgi:hypothetical protein